MSSKLGNEILNQFRLKNRKNKTLLNQILKQVESGINDFQNTFIGQKIINFYWINYYSEDTVWDFKFVEKIFAKDRKNIFSFYLNFILWLKQEINKYTNDRFSHSGKQYFNDGESDFSAYCINLNIGYEQIIKLLLNDESVLTFIQNNIFRIIELSLWTVIKDNNGFYQIVDSKQKAIIDVAQNEDVKHYLTYYVINFNRNSGDSVKAKNSIIDLLKDANTIISDGNRKVESERFFNASMLRDYRLRFIPLKHNKQDPTSREPSKYFDIYNNFNEKERMLFLKETMNTAMMIIIWNENF